jgi:ATP-dependent Clp protease adapter protein ClpS
MSDGQIETGYREIVVHDDDNTPAPFVIELLHAVFGKQLADAYGLSDRSRKTERQVAVAIPVTLRTV